VTARPTGGWSLCPSSECHLELRPLPLAGAPSRVTISWRPLRVPVVQGDAQRLGDLPKFLERPATGHPVPATQPGRPPRTVSKLIRRFPTHERPQDRRAAERWLGVCVFRSRGGVGAGVRLMSVGRKACPFQLPGSRGVNNGTRFQEERTYPRSKDPRCPVDKTDRERPSQARH
jgi:hypothetical protein